VTSFQVTLGAMIDSVLWFASHTRKKTGIAPKVSPSLGRVAYTGSATTRVWSPARHPAADAPEESAAAASGPESRQPISAANDRRLIRPRPHSAFRRLYGGHGRIATPPAFRFVLHRVPTFCIAPACVSSPTCRPPPLLRCPFSPGSGCFRRGR